MFSVPMRSAPRLRRDCSGAVNLVAASSPRVTAAAERSGSRLTTWSTRLDGVAMAAGLLLAAAILLVSMRASSEEWRGGGGQCVAAYGAFSLDWAAAGVASGDSPVQRHRPGIDPVDGNSAGRRDPLASPDFPLVREQDGRAYPQLRFSF